MRVSRNKPLRTDARTRTQTDGQLENSIPAHKNSLRGEGVNITHANNLEFQYGRKFSYALKRYSLLMHNARVIFAQCCKLFGSDIWF